jgi:hypothetical protein
VEITDIADRLQVEHGQESVLGNSFAVGPRGNPPDQKRLTVL